MTKILLIPDFREKEARKLTFPIETPICLRLNIFLSGELITKISFSDKMSRIDSHLAGK